MTITFVNPAFTVGGYRNLHWVEKDEPGTFRDANDYLGASRLSHTAGYYCDEYGDSTAVPAVHRIDIGEDEEGETQYVYRAAMHDPDNPGCGIVDDSETYKEAEEAARTAHGLAESYAEKEREYQEASSKHLAATEDQPSVLADLRKRHSYLCCRISWGRGNDAVGARMRAAIRSDAGDVVKNIRDLRSQWATEWKRLGITG